MVQSPVHPQKQRIADCGKDRQQPDHRHHRLDVVQTDRVRQQEAQAACEANISPIRIGTPSSVREKPTRTPDTISGSAAGPNRRVRHRWVPPAKSFALIEDGEDIPIPRRSTPHH
jgi:hypothetical protein